jgi:hypothetical protein
MRGRPAKGELALALVFGATGIVWIAVAAGMRLWQGFAPESGFLPLIYGVLLAALSGAILVDLFLAPRDETEREPIGKPLVLLLALTATAVGISVVGFAVAIFLLMAFLFAGLERLPLLPSLVVAGATTGALVLIFKVWLDVPLPLGPLGF